MGKTLLLLITLFVFACNTKEKQENFLTNKSTLKMAITADKKIYLEGKLIDFNEINTKIQFLTKDYSKELLSTYVVILSIDAKTGMGLVSDVKQELRKANALFIGYNTIGNEKYILHKLPKWKTVK